MIRTPRPRWLATSALLTAAFVLTACGGSDTGAQPDATSTSMSEGMDDGDHASFTFGEPADEADADRTIEVDTLDSLVFDPESIQVAAGETITFVVSNPGVAVHEFVIGDIETQDEHEAEMAEMMESEMVMGDEPNAVVLDAGETKSITWRFNDAGEVLYGCHQPGHYNAGMVGAFDLS